jgi:glycosyltransferase involved in cell wall biosynthesis
MNFERSLAAWTKLTYPKFEFLVIDNNSKTPRIEEIVNQYKDRLHITFFNEPVIQNINRTWNKYGKLSTGKYVIFSMMDEMISDGNIIDKMLKCPKKDRCSIFTYFMSEQETGVIDNYDWRTSVRNIPLPFTEDTSAGLISHITGAYRDYWEWLGWFRDDVTGHLWIDQDVHLRERRLGKEVHTPKDVYALHQWHKVDLEYIGVGQPGYTYQNDNQAMLKEDAVRDEA